MQRTKYIPAGGSDLVPDDSARAQLLLPLLTKKIENADSYLLEVRGKALKTQFKKLMRAMIANDELWEWSWSSDVGPRFCYAYGWALVRNGEIIAEETIHSS